MAWCPLGIRSDFNAEVARVGAIGISGADGVGGVGSWSGVERDGAGPVGGQGEDVADAVVDGEGSRGGADLPGENDD